MADLTSYATTEASTCSSWYRRFSSFSKCTPSCAGGTRRTGVAISVASVERLLELLGLRKKRRDAPRR
jgi:hypothetical protein